MQDMLFIESLQEKLDSLCRLLPEAARAEGRQTSELLDDLSALLQQYKAEYIDFRLICDHLNTTLFVTDADAKVVYINPSYRERTGLHEVELVGRTFRDLEESRIFRCDIISSILRDGKPMSAIGYAIPTDYRGFITGIPVKDGQGNIRYVVTTDWDVNTIMELENRLHQLKRGGTQSLEDTHLQDMPYDDEELLYVSDQMRTLMTLARTVAQTDVSVLITGETGTGKELLSKAIVKYSNRADKPYIRINCAAIPPNLLESELFGYSEGAFTGAKRGGKKGAFELANGGTILLDEIGELPLQLQAKLLRALQENEITPVGGQTPIKLDLRVIAATNRNLLQEIKNGSFREDLYYRLNIVPLELPSLRERAEDISFLVGRFTEEFSEKYHKTVLLDPGVMPLLRRYNWPGNIRELRNLIERLIIVCVDGRIKVEDVQKILDVSQATGEQSKGKTLREAVEQLEMWLIQEAVAEYGSKKKAAEMLGVERTTFVKKCQRYGID